MSKKHYNKGNLPRVWELMVHLHKTKPEVFDNPNMLRDFAGMQWKSLHDKEHCPNCKASMVSYWFEFDMPNAAMLVAMSRIVRARLEKGIDFTEANQIHVQTMNTASYAMKSRTTQMAKLGLITKLLKNKKHVSGYWLITRRGWEALANVPVPKKVESFRNTIIERDDEMTTIKEVFKEWTTKRKDLEQRNKKLKTTDYTDEVNEYERYNDWIHIGNIQSGLLI